MFCYDSVLVLEYTLLLLLFYEFTKPAPEETTAAALYQNWMLLLAGRKQLHLSAGLPMLVALTTVSQIPYHLF